MPRLALLSRIFIHMSFLDETSTTNALKQETDLDHPLFETYIYFLFLALRCLSSFLFVVSYEDTELLFEWKKDNGNKEVLVSEELEIPQFILTDYWTEANFSNFTSGKLGACALVIRLVLHFELPENFSLVRR